MDTPAGRHQRCWASGRTITDPEHVEGAKGPLSVYRAPRPTVIVDDLHRELADYDAAFCVHLNAPTGKTHIAIGLAVKAAHQGHRVLFATVTEWVMRLQCAHRESRLATELKRLRRIPLIVVDEVGYIPFEPEDANLFSQLVSSHYGHASIILPSNLPFARWGDVFGDHVVASAMIDRIVHHAEALPHKGLSYRMKDTKLTLPSEKAENKTH